MILTVEDQKRLMKEEAEKRAARVPALRAIFDGAIRYNEMLIDNPDWTDEQCLAFAREWHAVVATRFKEHRASLNQYSVGLDGAPLGWNEGIPYCRNDITKANLGL